VVVVDWGNVVWGTKEVVVDIGISIVVVTDTVVSGEIVVVVVVVVGTVVVVVVLVVVVVVVVVVVEVVEVVEVVVVEVEVVEVVVVASTKPFQSDKLLIVK